MFHVKKVISLRPSIVNLIQKVHISPVRFHRPSVNKRPSLNTEYIEINLKNAFETPYKCDSAANILLQYANSKFIPWDEVTKNVFDECVKNNSEQNNPPTASSIILQTCGKLKIDSLAVSYCKYLLSENKNLSLFDLFLIIKVLYIFGEKVAEHKELLKELLNKFKPYLSSNFAHGGVCVKVLCHDYDCWKDLVESYPSLKDVPVNILSVLASEAFKFNEYEIGCKIWNARLFTLKDFLFDSYLGYCIRKAEKGHFTPSLLNNLVKKCQKSFSVFPELHILSLFRTLVSTLNSDPNKTHSWEIYETKVNNFNTCLNCGESLDSLKITEEEFTKLRDHVLNDVIINKNVNIKTNDKELFNFLLYLKKIKYDIVLDGLNITYKQVFQKNSSGQGFIIPQIIDYFKKRNMKILFIGRAYLKKYSFFKYVKENCEVFFTDSLSDDDAFLLYATLHGGINTYFFTSDFFRGYHILIEDEEMQVVFRKWTIIRRYSFLPNSLIFREPKVHSFLPQQTNIKKKLRERGEMCWHFPVGCTSYKKMSGRTTVWYCLWRKSLYQNS